MAIIAVAGGTSPTLGKAIVTAIGQTSNKPVILSRKSASKPQPSETYGAEVRYVDYTSEQSLIEALRGVETVISVLKVPGPEWMTYQINLLNAAKAAGVKRFAPSEFEHGPLADGKVDILGLKLPVWDACKASDLECARFSCGMFMNYLAVGNEKLQDKKKEELAHGIEDEAIMWNLRKRTAELPIKADGSYPQITLTEIGDIGRLIAAACELPLGKWKENMGMVGETVNIAQATKLIEAKLGTKLKVYNVTADELKKRAAEVPVIGRDRPEILTKMLSQIALVMLEDKKGAGIIEPTVNELCPNVKPLNVSQYLDRIAA